jgi:hypothetical protein
MNKRPAKVIQKFKRYGPGQIGISVITISELQYGIAKSDYRKKNEQRLEEFLTPLEILIYDENAARTYTLIFCSLPKNSLLFQENQFNYICFDSLNPSFYYPRTQFSNIPLFHHSNRGRIHLKLNSDPAVVRTSISGSRQVI